MNTFFLTGFDDKPTSKQGTVERIMLGKSIRLKLPQCTATVVIKKATLVTKDVKKEDSHPKYSEIAYRLLKTFTGQHSSRHDFHEMFWPA